MEIRLNHISKSFIEGDKKRDILKDLNVSFSSNQLSIILGKSGSGKSTILNLVSGIDIPDRGEIVIDGQNISKMTDHQRTLFRRHHIGFVFQFFNLIPTLSVLENVMLVTELSGKADLISRKKAIDILEKVGLEDRLNATPDNLSGGEQQRTALARALVHDPKIVLADEPTGNLDHDTGKIVMDLMLDLTRQQGVTMIMATHSSDVLSAADQVFGIQECKLVQLEKRSK